MWTETDPTSAWNPQQFLADHTTTLWHVTVVCPSSCLSVCLSVYLFVTKCTVAKWYILQQKCLNKWIGNAPQEHDFITFNPLHRPIPSNSPPPKFRNFTYLLCLAFSITCAFCLCCCEHREITVINLCVVRSTIGYLSNSWASCNMLRQSAYCRQEVICYRI